MTLIVGRGPNAGYRGKCRETANKLVKEGKRVGFCWISTEDPEFFCHVCQKNHPKPTFSTQPVDELRKCPGCQTWFVFAEV